MEIHQLLNQHQLLTRAFGQEFLVGLCPVIMEVVDGVDQHVKHEVQQLLDHSQPLMEPLGLPVDPRLLLLHRPAHHEDLQRGFLLIQGLDLLDVDVDVPVQVVHLPDQKLVTLNRLKNGVGFFQLELEDVVDYPQGLVVVADGEGGVA